MLELYKRIKNRREELQMSQDELAKKMGYKSRSSIQKIEKGENDIPQSKIKFFAQALQTTPEYLMGWTSSDDSETDKKPSVQLESEEIRLVNAYRELNKLNKQQILNMISAFLIQQTATA